MMRTDLLWADVKITNRKGLLRTLNEEFETEYPSLEDALDFADLPYSMQEKQTKILWPKKKTDQET